MSELSDFSFSYGIEGNYRDVTNETLKFFSGLSPPDLSPPGLSSSSSRYLEIIIPKTDTIRAIYYGDSLPGVLKHVRVIFRGVSKIFSDNEMVNYSLKDLTKEDIAKVEAIKQPFSSSISSFSSLLISISDPNRKLDTIHNFVKFHFGTLKDELPEQLMATRFISPNDVVLELGSNIGRNTLTIASLLANQKNLVTLECDKTSSAILKINRNVNGYTFHVEESALSKQKLIQQGWNTIPSDVVLPGYTSVDIITFTELESKYLQLEDTAEGTHDDSAEAAEARSFNTLVADCEGALFYILQDFPEMLTNISKVLMENDYLNIEHKRTVDRILQGAGFSRVYVAGGGWGPCKDFFFETWAKTS